MKFTVLSLLMTLWMGCGSTKSTPGETKEESEAVMTDTRETTETVIENNENRSDEIAKEEDAMEAAEAELKGATVSDLAGTWQMTVDSPRGKRTSTITVSEENGNFMGVTDNNSFDMVKDGNDIIWSSSLDTPMGSMEANYKATLDGDTMRGTMEMTSGMMKGREMNFTATRDK